MVHSENSTNSSSFRHTNDVYTVGSTVTFVCNEGYELTNGNVQKILTCTDNYTWSGDSEHCSRMYIFERFTFVPLECVVNWLWHSTGIESSCCSPSKGGHTQRVYYYFDLVSSSLCLVHKSIARTSRKYNIDQKVVSDNK